jgi:hypothetical protein
LWVHGSKNDSFNRVAGGVLRTGGDGFFTGRHAELAWHGLADLRPLGVLLGAAAAGIALVWARETLPRRSWAGRSWVIYHPS